MKSKKKNNIQDFSNSIYEKIFQNAADGIHLIDPVNFTTVLINSPLCKNLGYSKNELINMDIWKIFLEKDFQNIKNEIKKIEQNEKYNLCNVSLLCKNKKIFLTDIFPSFFEYENQKYLLFIYRDIRKRIECEEHFKDVLEEKDMFIREINHRVKNNLQVISSFLNFQLINLDECITKKILYDIDNKIRAVSLLYDHVCQNCTDDKINAKKYLHEMIDYIWQNNLSNDENISIYYKIHIDEIYIKMNMLLPIALIINELITNACKHAFDDMNSGVIEVSLKKNKDDYTLTFSDNGKGMSETEDVAVNKYENYGQIILRALVTQLDGKMEVQTGDGTKYILTIPA